MSGERRAPRGPDEPRREAAGEGPATVAPPTRPRRAWILGAVLVAVSILLPAAALVVPFLPLSVAWKAGAFAALLAAGEVAFWLAALVLGREVVRRYRRFLDPRHWLDKIDKKPR